MMRVVVERVRVLIRVLFMGKPAPGVSEGEETAAELKTAKRANRVSVLKNGDATMRLLDETLNSLEPRHGPDVTDH